MYFLLGTMAWLALIAIVAAGAFTWPPEWQQD
jgi:hypothetical protein